MTTQTIPSLAPADPFPPSLGDFVRRFVARSRQLNAIEACGIGLAFIVIWTLIWCLFDRLLPTPAWFRGLLLLIEAAATVMLLVRPVRRLLSADVPWHRAAAAIEARDPQFGGALQTALSQLLMPAYQRGSESMLAHVVDQTVSKATAADPRLLLPPAKAFRPAIIAAAALLLMCILLTSSWLDLPRLLARQLFPFLSTAPVTTTRLFVEPGSVNVIEGEALKITVRTERLGDSQPILQWRGDDPVFSSALMQPDHGGFSYTFASIDRAMTYRVSGGDATSALFDVHVIARPAVRQLRVSYAYPDWTELPAKAEAVTSGDLEAPSGTTATVSIIASQSLAKAAGVFDGARIESTPSVDPAVRLLTIPMRTSGPWRLEITNADGITGKGPSGMMLRVVRPQSPQANLRLPLNENELRLHPRDVLTLGYDATDQFALAKISTQIAVNALPPVEVAIPLGANHQTQSGSFDVDLAQLAVNLGDIVTITLTAENRAGLRGTSTPCRIVVSPRSIDLNAEQRLSELREAAGLAKALNDEAAAASKALDQSPPGDDKQARDEQIAPHLAVADGITTELSRQLMRAVTHSSSVDLSNALAWMVDDTQRSASGFEAADAAILTEMRDPLRDRLNRLGGVTNELQQSLDAFCRGEFASQLLAEAQDAKADESRLNALPGAQADAVRRSAQLARADEKTGCTKLGIDPNAADVEAQLQQRVDQANEIVKRFGQVDFASAANEWSVAGHQGGTGLVARLTVASQVEAVRQRGDFIWARDLELSAKAARRIDTVEDLPHGARGDYPPALRALQQVHVLLVARTPSAQMVEPMKVADEARKRMRLWAGELEPTSQPTASQIAQDPERAALEAAAAEAERKLQQDASLDHATTMPADAAPLLDLPPTPNDSPNGIPNAAAESSLSPAEMAKLKQTVATVRRLERLSAEQRILRKETAQASDAQLRELAKQQAALTDAIQNARPDEPLADQAHADQSQSDQAHADQAQPDQAHADQGQPDQAHADQAQQDQAQGDHAQPDQPQDDAPKDSREAAMNAIRSAQERLAEMPKEIEGAHQAENQQHDANQRAEGAQHDADSADAQTKGAQELLAAAARAEADTAKTQASAKQVSPDEAANLADALRQFAPEATPAVDAIDQQLTPALTAMRQTQAAGDHAANQQATQQATQAVAEAQRRLNEGLQGLLKRDALTTAKFFSNKAAQAMAQAQPDRAAALKLQRGASAALEQAWDNSLHQAAGQRLARMPSMSAILRLYPTEAQVMGATSLGAEPAPAEREWGRLREQRPEDLSAGSHEIDPPEYQDALRVYFRDLAREDAEAKQ